MTGDVFIDEFFEVLGALADAGSEKALEGGSYGVGFGLL
jgi:hypothetical protein